MQIQLSLLEESKTENAHFELSDGFDEDQTRLSNKIGDAYFTSDASKDMTLNERLYVS